LFLCFNYLWSGLYFHLVFGRLLGLLHVFFGIFGGYRHISLWCTTCPKYTTKKSSNARGPRVLHQFHTSSGIRFGYRYFRARNRWGDQYWWLLRKQNIRDVMVKSTYFHYIFALFPFFYFGAIFLLNLFMFFLVFMVWYKQIIKTYTLNLMWFTSGAWIKSKYSLFFRIFFPSNQSINSFLFILIALSWMVVQNARRFK